MSRRKKLKAPKHGAPAAEINITPLVDVVLVLLIIFMVVTPQMDKGPPIELPSSKTTRESDQKAKPLVVGMDEKGDMFLGEDKVDRGKLMRALTDEAVKTKKAPNVMLRADQEVQFVHIRELMQWLRDAGAGSVKLAAIESEG